MMRAFLFTIALNLLAPLWGQEVVRFDTIHQNVVGSFAVGVSVFETDSGYRVFSVQKGLSDMSQDVFVDEFNVGGGLVSERTFQSYQQDWMGSSSPVQTTVGVCVAGMSRGLVVGPLDSLFLYRFTAEGDTAWTRFVAVDTALAMRGTAVTAAGDVLLTGIHYPGWSDGGNEAFVYHLDSTGTIKSYHGYADFNGEDVVEGLDGSWYVCGQGNSGATYGQPILIRSDTAGNELWRRSDELYGNYFSLIPTLDSGIVALGYRADGFVEGPLAKVIKYDRAGEEQWMRELYQSSFDEWPCRLYTGFQQADSTFIVAGALRDTIQGYAGMVFHLDKEGNTIWQRFYTRFQGFELNHDQIFWDVKRTSDGGLILTGETSTDDYPHAQLWLLKLDSLGCLVPGCQSVGVEEYTDRYNGKLLLWPNPASGQVSLSLEVDAGLSTRGALRVHVVDGQGCIVYQQPARLIHGQLSATIDVNGLSEGIYHVHLADERLWLAGAKLMVEH